jgi:hypothetical protein
MLKGLAKGARQIGTTSWAGWGFEMTRPLWMPKQPIVKYFPGAANNASLETLRDEPVFRNNPPEILKGAISDDKINESLAKGIPALSTPAGHEPISLPYGAEIDNMDCNAYKENGWPKDHDKWKKRWLHSDIKNMAFLYVMQAFNEIVRTGDLK